MDEVNIYDQSMNINVNHLAYGITLIYAVEEKIIQYNLLTIQLIEGEGIQEPDKGQLIALME